MKIEYRDIVLLNDQLQKLATRYRVSYKNDQVACIEPPGECCLTGDRKERAFACIEDYFNKKGISVVFSDDRLYFSCAEKQPEKPA